MPIITFVIALNHTLTKWENVWIVLILWCCFSWAKVILFIIHIVSLHTVGWVQSIGNVCRAAVKCAMVLCLSIRIAYVCVWSIQRVVTAMIWWTRVCFHIHTYMPMPSSNVSWSRIVSHRWLRLKIMNERKNTTLLIL